MSAHRTTRRAMLAGAATLSATTAIAAGAAIAAPVDDDPIFAAIDAHRRAKRAWEKASTEADLPGLTPSARVIVGYQKEGEYLTTHAEDGGLTVRFVPNGKDHPTYVQCPEDIECNVPKDLDGRDRDAWIADRKAELEQEEERVAAEYAQTERGKLQAIADAADDLEMERAWDLIWTVPTTLGGVAALLAYIRKNGSLDELVEDDAWINALEWTIEKAVCAIAGLPEPPMDKIVARLWNEGEVAAS